MKIKVAKQIAGLVLIITFFLPLSRCEMKKVEVQQAPFSVEGKDNIAVNSSKITESSSNEKSDSDKNIPYKMFSAKKLISWLMLLSFFWPIPLLLYFHFGKSKTILAGLTLVEPLACIGSGYMVWAISTFGDILFAGYLALGAILIYFIASCHDNYVLIKRFIKNKKGEQEHSH